jgi:hypothetical protein
MDAIVDFINAIDLCLCWHKGYEAHPRGRGRSWQSNRLSLGTEIGQDAAEGRGVPLGLFDHQIDQGGDRDGPNSADERAVDAMACKMETLREAHSLAKQNDGAPGVDGVTFEAVETQAESGCPLQHAYCWNFPNGRIRPVSNTHSRRPYCWADDLILQ